MKLNVALATANIDLVRRAFDAFNRGEIETCAQLMVSDFVANIAGAPQPIRSREAWKHGSQEFRNAFPDLQACIEDIFATEDRVAVRLSFRGMHAVHFKAFRRPVVR